MAKVFYVDVARCTGCYNCQLACKDEHCGNDWTPYAKPQPEIGQFWCRVEEHVGGTMPKVKIHYISQMCNHCANAPCMAAARDGAVYRRDDGLVIIDPEKAVGQRQIVDACPYGAIYWNEELQLPQKCTGCARLLDNGEKVPRCVEACPTDALRFGEEEELKDLIRGAEVLKPELGLGPKVYYRNIPGRFIAGTLFDPEEQEIIEGARCHLSDGSKNWDVTTDDFGDFWFRDLPVGRYDLRITAPGYQPVLLEGLDTEKDLNVGDLPMKKA